jgi:hypothetical protein
VEGCSHFCGSHNIPKALIGHAYAGRLRENEKKIVRDMSLCKVKPKQIIVTLKNRDPNNNENRLQCQNLFEVEGFRKSKHTATSNENVR